MWIHRRSPAALVAAVIAVGACAPFMRGGSPQPTYPLVVKNSSDFEVVIYAIQSTGSNGIRLGNARTYSTMTMHIPRNALQGTQTLLLRLHSIGAVKSCPGISAGCNRSPSFIAGPTTVDSNLVIHLDIRADHNGGLTYSTLYSDVLDRISPVVASAKRPQ